MEIEDKIKLLESKDIPIDPEVIDIDEGSLFNYEKHPDWQIEKISQEKLKTSKLSEELNIIKDDRSIRKIYVFGIFIFVSLYMLLVLAIICFIKINDNVLIALLGSSSINIIGLLAAVVRYLFPRRDGKESQ